ncbi:MAG: hypothetical protein KGQ45_13985 [Burkholderiales bacterium]|nr:hypothetical protein [Burkholderiales bacterium]
MKRALLKKQTEIAEATLEQDVSFFERMAGTGYIKGRVDQLFDVEGFAPAAADARLAESWLPVGELVMTPFSRHGMRPGRNK